MLLPSLWTAYIIVEPLPIPITLLFCETIVRKIQTIKYRWIYITCNYSAIWLKLKLPLQIHQLLCKQQLSLRSREVPFLARFLKNWEYLQTREPVNLCQAPCAHTVLLNRPSMYIFSKSFYGYDCWNDRITLCANLARKFKFK